MTEEHTPRKANSATKTNFFMGFFAGMALLSVIAFFVLLIVVFSNKQPVDLAANAQPDEVVNDDVQEPTASPVPPIDSEDYVFGNKDAKVVLIEYTDFECPFCARHYETAKQIKATYGNKIAFVTRHFPLSFHQNAQKASEASECAGEQGKFWEMYDKIFEANLVSDMSVTKWKSVAKALGLNTTKFDTCLDSGQYASKISKQMNEGGAAGVSGTPATFVNGQLISGALPFEQFKGLIDGLLGE
ncbi:DsbA family protein [Candidatus Kuenenbacteria bacterium]|nr:DsbA family protein [Candidatus Kuenenbacteria bacterium]